MDETLESLTDLVDQEMLGLEAGGLKAAEDDALQLGLGERNKFFWDGIDYR